MKIVIHKGWGSFYVPLELEEKFEVKYNYCIYDCADEIRMNSELIEYLETHSDGSEFKVFDIPKETTDYIISDYDGWETLYYVVDGKIHSDEEVEL